MKRFIKVFIVSYIIATIFFIWFWGNFNLFGEQGFHMDMDTIVDILETWALIPALVISAIVSIIGSLKNKHKK